VSKFKVGDKVVKKSGHTWSGGADVIATVSREDFGDIWLEETGTWMNESSLDFASDYVQPTEATEEHTGGSSSYYSTKVAYPLNVDQEAYTAECEDIAEALQMTPAEYNVFKSTWRKAAARQGKKKKGNNAVYDAEKCVFYSGRMLVAAKRGVV
jgi:hypothetical protein